MKQQRTLEMEPSEERAGGRAPEAAGQAGGSNAATQDRLRAARGQTPGDGMGAGTSGGARPRGWGEAIGSFNGVTAYSNGGASRYWERGTYGYMYQCVEYVNRYSVKANGTGNMIGTGNAIDYAGRSRSSFGYTWVANEASASLPEAGDILVFGGGTFGHVAIATRGGPGGVGMIQQNTSSATSSLTVSGGPGRYTVGTWGGRRLLGWQHYGAVRRAAPAGDAPAPRGGASSSAATYTVRPGDSLWSIAARTLGDGSRYTELAALNGLRDPGRIVTGQVLKLPGRSAAAAAPAPSAPKAPAPAPVAPKVAARTYTVRRGDSLWDIAERSLGDGARYREIARLNGIANPSRISVGAVLKLPS